MPVKPYPKAERTPGRVAQFTSPKTESRPSPTLLSPVPANPLPQVLDIYEGLTRAERRVAGFLNSRRVRWEFERPVYVTDPDGRPRIWTPDFYLLDFAIYVEVIGNPGADYEFREFTLAKNEVESIFVRPFQDNWMRKLLAEIRDVHNRRAQAMRRLDLPREESK